MNTEVIKEFQSLIGNRYNKLTVEEYADKTSNGERRWLCRCECGNTTIVTERNLKSLHTLSCGCAKSPDLTRKTFGKLTVIGRSDKRGKRGQRTVMLWECRCECGAITYKAKDTLTNPNLCMCAECAGKYSADKARENAGFIEGTQLAKIYDMTPSVTNTSGCRGVYYESKYNRWRAEIQFQRKRYYLGTYKKYEDAVKARKTAEADLYVTFLERLKEEVHSK